MTNPNDPVVPQSLPQPSFVGGSGYGAGGSGGSDQYSGLTKREKMSMELFKSLIERNSTFIYSGDAKELAKIAVSAADSLIEELNRK